ncbi:hypothetical protein MMC07_001939 [Pseudocyphellaria aurata]|nr:hypothetical protein [Pseudocyphellaria aurata]
MPAGNDLNAQLSALAVADISAFDTTDSDFDSLESAIFHDMSGPDGPTQAIEPMNETPREGVFRFLQLPAEIRLAVYHHLVVGPGAVQLYKDDFVRRFQSETHNQIDLAIFLANRQVWAECSKVFFVENVFRFYIYGDEVDWPPTFPNLKRIRKCALSLRNPCNVLSSFDERRMIARRTLVAMESFGRILAGDKEMEYLLIEIPDKCIGYDVKDILEPLQKVRNIKHVHIASFSIIDWSFLQNLECAMSLDHKNASLVRWSLSHGLDGMLKQVAQSIRRVIERGKGGTQANENQDLFAYFGITPRHNYKGRALFLLDSGSTIGRYMSEHEAPAQT